MKSKIIFLGGFYPCNESEKHFTKCSLNRLLIAPNTFQWGVIDGLQKNEVDFFALSFPFLPTYPLGYSQLLTPSCPIISADKIVGKMESYCALIGYKDYSIEHGVYNSIRNIIESSPDNKEIAFTVLTYTPCSVFIKPLVKLKKKYNNLKVCAIVTDLIDEFFNPIYHRSFFKKIQGRLEFNSVHRNYKHIDKYVLLTKSMEERVPNAKGNSIVVEGIFSDSGTNPVDKMQGVRSLLYSGSLATHSCVNELVDAFMSIDNPNYRLIICGSGTLEGYVKDKALIDSRIVFRGVLPREDVVRLQKAVTAVINPRNPSISLTKYSFPSKTMEYLASGTPMIGYQLQGIPDEYYNYMYTVDNNNVKNMAISIDRVLSTSDEQLNAMASKAREFIVRYKNSEYQVRKIIELLK